MPKSRQPLAANSSILTLCLLAAPFSPHFQNAIKGNAGTRYEWVDNQNRANHVKHSAGMRLNKKSSYPHIQSRKEEEKQKVYAHYQSKR